MSVSGVSWSTLGSTSVAEAPKLEDKALGAAQKTLETENKEIAKNEKAARKAVVTGVGSWFIFTSLIHSVSVGCEPVVLSHALGSTVGGALGHVLVAGSVGLPVLGAAAAGICLGLSGIHRFKRGIILNALDHAKEKESHPEKETNDKGKLSVVV